MVDATFCYLLKILASLSGMPSSHSSIKPRLQPAMARFRLTMIGLPRRQSNTSNDLRCGLTEKDPNRPSVGFQRGLHKMKAFPLR